MSEMHVQYGEKICHMKDVKSVKPKISNKKGMGVTLEMLSGLKHVAERNADRVC